MKFLVFFIFFSLSSLASQEVVVDFEWEQIPGSIEYEVQILDQKKKILKKLNSPTFSFQVELAPGRYFIKGRVKDQRRAYSNWSVLSEFNIQPQKPQLKESPPPLLKPDEKKFTANLRLEWERTKGANNYLVTVKDETGKVIQELKTQETATSIVLKPGKYRYEVTSISDSGIKSETLSSKEWIEVPKIDLKRLKNVRFEKQKINFEKSLELPIEIGLFHKFYYGDWVKVFEDKTDKDFFEIKNDLKPGEYRLVSRHVSPLGEKSEPFEIFFVIKPKDLP